MRRPIHADLRVMRVASNSVNAVLDQYQRDLVGLYPLSEVRAIAAAVFHHALGWDLIRVLTDRDAALSESELLRVTIPLKRLRAGEPLQYVLGETTFHGLVIGVDPSVLIPRPETEEMVDLILRSDIRPSRVIDIGTGSGCIALALKKGFPAAEVAGIEVSDQALLRAMDNGRRNALEVTWLHGDILQPEMELPAADLIVSNPPYVPRSEEASLDLHVRAHEPHLALFVEDAAPLLFYRAIATKALRALSTGGALWFEGHHVHAPMVADLLRQLGYGEVRCINDLSGSPRFVRALRT
jgi:release factor glutamine methyltransferase